MTRRGPRGGGRAGICCARCGRVSPIRVDELSGGGEAPGGETMLAVLVPPDHTPDTPFEAEMDWIADPDGDGIICTGTDCATTDEIAAYMAGLAEIERIVGEIDDDEDEPPVS